MVVTAAAIALLLPLVTVAAVQVTPPDSACERARCFLLNRHLNVSYLDSCESKLAAAARTGSENE